MFSLSLKHQNVFLLPACEIVEKLIGEDSALAAPPCNDSLLNLLFSVMGVEGVCKLYKE